ncbi:hypothetical protein GYB22_12720 [bacterium]|nr:hypothetical protein [bacterium]
MMAKVKTSIGFSIEIEGYSLELKGNYLGDPLYECYGGRIKAVAVVDNPAIGVNAVSDDNNKKLIGPIMIPDLKIKRPEGPYGYEDCYWFFSKETIAKYQREFNGPIKLGH